MTSINASHISEAAHRDALRFPHTGQVNLKDISEGTYLTSASHSRGELIYVLQRTRVLSCPKNTKPSVTARPQALSHRQRKLPSRATRPNMPTSTA